MVNRWPSDVELDGIAYLLACLRRDNDAIDDVFGSAETENLVLFLAVMCQMLIEDHPAFDAEVMAERLERVRQDVIDEEAGG